MSTVRAATHAHHRRRVSLLAPVATDANGKRRSIVDDLPEATLDQMQSPNWGIMRSLDHDGRKAGSEFLQQPDKTLSKLEPSKGGSPAGPLKPITSHAHPLLGAVEYHAEQLCLGLLRVLPGSPTVGRVQGLMVQVFEEVLTGKVAPGSSLPMGAASFHSKLDELHAKVDSMRVKPKEEEEEDDQPADLPEEGSEEYRKLLAAHMFSMMDHDDNMEIELEDAAMFITRAGVIKWSAEQVARKYDADGNGKISLEEFELIVKDLYTKDGGVSIWDRNNDEDEDGDENNDASCWKSLMDPIHPESKFGFRCTFVTMLLVLYSAFLIPARLGFESEESAGPITTALDFISEFWFIFDIYISFRLGYEDPDTLDLVMDLVMIRKTYLRGWFGLDFISSLPIRTVTVFAPRVRSFGFLKVFRLCKLFRLVKLLKLKVLEDLENSGHVSPSLIRVGKLFFTFILLMHMVACGYWVIVRSTCHVCEPSSWNDISSKAHCGTNYTRTIQPAFTTPFWCPDVWRVRGFTDYTSSEDEATLTDAYMFSFYW